MAAKRERYWDKRGKGESDYDDIVVGSGMGGMTTAAILARLGRKVLVVEQHYTPGGFTHSFKRPGGYEWDVGVHAVGEVTTRALPGRILHKLTEGRLEWASLGGVYDEFHFPEGFRIDFPDSPQAFEANLVEAFPAERDAIQRYLALVKDVVGGMRSWFLGRSLPAGAGAIAERLIARKALRWTDVTTTNALSELTGDARLRTVLSSQWGYYGARPSEAAFLIQALVTQHFKWGAYYPVGGSGRIATELLRPVAQAGGWTRISTPVERILIEAGRAVGVELEGGERIRASRVFSAVGVPSTVTRLLPTEIGRKAWASSITNLAATPAHVCLHLGFKGDIRHSGAGSANKWFWRTWDAEAPDWDVSDPENLGPAPVLYTSFPSLKDPAHANPDRHTAEVVTFVPWKDFQSWRGSRWHKRGDGYDAYKQALEEHLLGQFLERMPDLRDQVDHVELSTPLTTDHFVRPRAGGIYGIAPTPTRFANKWLRPRSPIPGLFFSGSDVGTVGVIGAMMGGVLAALSAEPIRGVRYLRDAF